MKDLNYSGGSLKKRECKERISRKNNRESRESVTVTLTVKSTCFLRQLGDRILGTTRGKTMKLLADTVIIQLSAALSAALE